MLQRVSGGTLKLFSLSSPSSNLQPIGGAVIGIVVVVVASARCGLRHMCSLVLFNGKGRNNAVYLKRCSQKIKNRFSVHRLPGSRQTLSTVTVASFRADLLGASNELAAHQEYECPANGKAADARQV